MGVVCFLCGVRRVGWSLVSGFMWVCVVCVCGAVAWVCRADLRSADPHVGQCMCVHVRVCSYERECECEFGCECVYECVYECL